MYNLADEISYLVCAEMAILAGGSLRGVIDRDDKLVDYDLFFNYQQRPKSTEQFLLDIGYSVAFKCPAGFLTTLLHPASGCKVQLITERHWGSADELIDSFDIIAGCAYLTARGDVVCHPGFPSAIANKLITFHRVTYPVSTLLRVQKYTAKGYRLRQDAARWLTETLSQGEWAELNLRGYID